MSKFPDKKEEIDSWLNIISELNIKDFCSYWIPIIYNINEADKEYRAACLDLLEKIFKKQRKTIENWLWNPEMVPQYARQQLGLLDRLWRVRQQVISQKD